jgi:MFS family permease
VAAAAAPALGGLVAELAGWSAMLAVGALAALGAVLALRHLVELTAAPLSR